MQQNGMQQRKRKQAKDKKGLLADEVCNKFYKAYKTNFHQKRVGNLATKGYNDVTPTKWDVRGKIPSIVYKSVIKP